MARKNDKGSYLGLIGVLAIFGVGALVAVFFQKLGDGSFRPNGSYAHQEQVAADDFAAAVKAGAKSSDPHIHAASLNSTHATFQHTEVITPYNDPDCDQDCVALHNDDQTTVVSNFIGEYYDPKPLFGTYIFDNIIQSPEGNTMTPGSCPSVCLGDKNGPLLLGPQPVVATITVKWTGHGDEFIAYASTSENNFLVTGVVTAHRADGTTQVVKVVESYTERVDNNDQHSRVSYVFS